MLKSRNECRYMIRVSKLVYKSRRSICCIGRLCSGAIFATIGYLQSKKMLFEQVGAKMQMQSTGVVDTRVKCGLRPIVPKLPLCMADHYPQSSRSWWAWSGRMSW